jgi:hypothetical protein
MTSASVTVSLCVYLTVYSFFPAFPIGHACRLYYGHLRIAKVYTCDPFQTRILYFIGTVVFSFVISASVLLFQLSML